MEQAHGKSAPESAADLDLANALADAAADIAIQHFNPAGTSVTLKADGSPVTAVDLLVESVLRARLQRERPGDGFLGEESAGHVPAQRCWYIDPIDGTAGFAQGRTTWRTLIALEEAGTILLGLVSVPMLQQRWWAQRGSGAWKRVHDTLPEAGPIAPQQLAVSRTASLTEANVAIWPTPDEQGGPHKRTAARLASRLPPLDRSPDSGLPGALMVASGQLDAFISVGAGPWDIAAMVPIVEEAGGRYSDVTGGRSLHTPAAVFTNGRLHDQIVSLLFDDRAEL